jgi:hypothetical protein
VLAQALGAALAGEMSPEVVRPDAISEVPLRTTHPGEPVRVRAPRSNTETSPHAPGEPVRMRIEDRAPAVAGEPVVLADGDP